MTTTQRFIVTALGAAASAAFFVPSAGACGVPSVWPATFQMQTLRADVRNPLEGASPESVLRDLRSTAGEATVVGMWQVTFISQGNTGHNPSIPDGAQIDFGYSQWHSDGNEFLNSGGRAPAIQNYCLGAYAKTGDRAYQLNHFAINYDMNGNHTGTVNILETITVSAGGTAYSGTFTINAYDLKGNQVDHVTGQITGKRVTVDTAP